MESRNETIRDHIRQLKDQEHPKPPYEMEGRPGRFTKIKEDQRMFDTEDYCLEVKQRLLQAINSGMFDLNPDMLFMDESVFAHGDNDTPFVAPEKSNIKKPWWDDDEYLSQFNEDAPPESKVRRYLRDSQG